MCICTNHLTICPVSSPPSHPGPNVIVTQTAQLGFEEGAKLTGVVSMIQTIKTGGFEYSYIDGSRHQRLLFFTCDDKGEAKEYLCPH